MKNKQSYLVAILFCVIIMGLFLTNLILPDQSFSDTENRFLQQFPKLSLSGLWNNDFQNSFESYQSDQFVGREKLKKLKTSIDYYMGIRQVDDVYIGKDGMLFQSFTSPSKSELQDKIDAVNEFVSKYPKMKYHMLMIPNKIAIYEDLLPAGLPTSNQKEILQQYLQELSDSINKIDTYSLLQEFKDEYLYYNTDHHWTIRAANLVFETWLQENKLKPLETYETYISNDNFIGTLANRSGYYQNSDSIELMIPKDSKVNYIVNYVEEGLQIPSVYDSSKQFSNDPYTVFFGGNHPRIDIVTTVENNKHLLIFKDSYANCFIPFLLPYYSEITVIDPRYYYEDIHALIKDKKINEIMFLYNANTYFSDYSLEELIQ